MTETKHTPGPWVKIGKSIGVEYGEIATAWDLDGKQQANALLIAAAPELLDVLKELAALDFGALVMNDDDERRIDFVARKARTAIAKATGETQ